MTEDLNDLMCPHSAAGRPERFPAKACILAGECGCVYGAERKAGQVAGVSPAEPAAAIERHAIVCNTLIAYRLGWIAWDPQHVRELQAERRALESAYQLPKRRKSGPEVAALIERQREAQRHHGECRCGAGFARYCCAHCWPQ